MTAEQPPLIHLGFIADGNRRWARACGLPTLEGHRTGYDKVETLINALKNTEVKYVSFFVFSTENWSRSKEEVAYLMQLLRDGIERFSKKNEHEDVRIVIMGRPEPVDPAMWQKLLDIEEKTKDNTGLTVCFCFNYGGKWEIADAATRAIAAGETSLTPDTFAKYLYHPEIPDLDMVVRTSGEERTSGFQLWRAAYSEMLFLDKHFPDIEAEDCQLILDEFHHRQRRFGK